MAAQRGVTAGLLVLLAAGFADYGWQLMPGDKPRIAQGLAYLLTGLLAALHRTRRPTLLGLACTYVLWSASAGLACVLWFPRLLSRELGVCDEGTGLPVGLFLGVGLLLVAAEFLRGNDR